MTLDPTVHGRDTVESGHSAQAIQGLHDRVVPQVKGAPGFVKGTWVGDTESGYGLTIFETEEQAQQTAGMITAAPEDPVQIEEIKVYEVHAEA